MEKIAKDFWGKEILICGCEKKDVGFLKNLHKTLTEHGVEVYALATKPEVDPGFETYPDLSALPHVPACAYVMAPKEELSGIVEELKSAGVGRIVVYNKKKADDSFVADCASKGVEVRAGCPLMLYRGFPCSMHAAFAGVGAERKK